MRLAYTTLRVLDLDRSVEFYKTLGMTSFAVAQFTDADGRPFRVAMIGYGMMAHVLELVENVGRDEAYDLGDGFGQVCVTHTDPASLVEACRAKGYTVLREVSPMGGGNDREFGFVADPDGYRVQIKHQDAGGKWWGNKSV